jgi:hypothetical protein
VNQHQTNFRGPLAARPCLFLTAILAAAVLAGCQPAEPSMPKAGANTHHYNYTAWDKEGRVVCRGVLALQYDDPRTCRGVWEFQPIGTPQRIGPQTGKGALTGRKDAGQLTLNLNPDKPNYYVSLVGSQLGNNIDGAWRWNGVGGILNQGKFTAVRK